MSKETSGRKLFFLSQQEIELIIASIDFLKSEASSNGCNGAHVRCRNFTSNRIDELIKKMKGAK